MHIPGVRNPNKVERGQLANIKTEHIYVVSCPVGLQSEVAWCRSFLCILKATVADCDEGIRYITHTFRKLEFLESKFCPYMYTIYFCMNEKKNSKSLFQAPIGPIATIHYGGNIGITANCCKLRIFLGVKFGWKIL